MGWVLSTSFPQISRNCEVNPEEGYHLWDVSPEDVSQFQKVSSLDLGSNSSAHNSVVLIRGVPLLQHSKLRDQAGAAAAARPRVQAIPQNHFVPLGDHSFSNRILHRHHCRQDCDLPADRGCLGPFCAVEMPRQAG